MEAFALATTLLILLPTAVVGHLHHRRTGRRARAVARVFRWRFIGWWLVVLFGLPVIALSLGLIGGSFQTADLRAVLIKQLGSRWPSW
jgi:hypothetical protein